MKTLFNWHQNTNSKYCFRLTWDDYYNDPEFVGYEGEGADEGCTNEGAAATTLLEIKTRNRVNWFLQNGSVLENTKPDSYKNLNN